MTDWVQGNVVKLHRWTERLYSLQVDAEVAPFQAGQFTRVALDIDGERVGRPYSFVNAPGESPLEFYFITVPDGPLSNRMTTLVSGDTIWISKQASGFFTLAEIGESRYLWLLSTGTAIGPFISILKTEEPWRRFERIVLVHGVRKSDELTYQDTLNKYEQHQQFRMISVVSRDDVGHAIKGRITNAIEDGRLEDIAGIPLSADDSQVMICGNPDMVRDTTRLLEARGFKKHRRRDPGQVTTENYWKQKD